MIAMWLGHHIGVQLNPLLIISTRIHHKFAHIDMVRSALGTCFQSSHQKQGRSSDTREYRYGEHALWAHDEKGSQLKSAPLANNHEGPAMVATV
jgi:hypothetical protein